MALTTLFEYSKINIIAYIFGCFTEILHMFVRETWE
jgi:hypothetical protein